MTALLLPLLAAARTEVGGWRWSDLPAAWLLTLAVLVLFLFARALYRSERARAPTWVRLGLAGLRTLALLLILLVLSGPYREVVTTVEERSHLVVLVDASASMRTVDRHPPEEEARLRDAARLPGEGPLEASRLDLVRRVLASEDEALLRALDSRFVLHVFAFDEDWRSLGSTREDAGSGAREERAAGAEAGAGEDPIARIADAVRGLEPLGGNTRIGNALRGVATEFLGREDRRLAGVLLVTDGRDTSEGEAPLEALAGLGSLRRDLHVTAVALGNPASARNARMERIRAKDVVLIGDDVAFETAIRHQGFTGLDGVRARLHVERVADARGASIAPEPHRTPGSDAPAEVGPLRLGAEEEPTPVRMRALFEQAGTFRVRIEAVLPPDAAREDAIGEDNVAVHELRVKDQRIKVLYVDNFPRYDWRFLQNWLTREPKKEPGHPERRRRYAANVLLQSADPTVEMPSSPGVDPIRSFPRTRRDLFDYDVVIIGDVNWRSLAEDHTQSREILELLRDFVEEGGGLAFQVGENFHNPLGFYDTPLQDLLPIAIHNRDENASKAADQPFRVELTDVGARHPIFAVVPGREGLPPSPDEIRDTWAGDRFLSREWAWWWLYRATGGLKPGAMELARVRPPVPGDRAFLDDRGRPLVVFATMGYGRGRVFLSTLDVLSRLRWSQQDRIYGAFWDQVVRYLATYPLLGGNKRYKIISDKDTYFRGETATITVTALDRDFEPLAAPWLEGMHVEDPRGEDRLLEGDERPPNVSAEGAAPGTYRFHLPIRDSGTYRIWIRDPAGGREGEDRAEKRLTAEFRAPELRNTLPDHDLLRHLVQESDGMLLDGRLARLPDLARVAESLPTRTVQRVLDRRPRTEWDQPWVLLLLVGLLAVEWVVRKRFTMI